MLKVRYKIIMRHDRYLEEIWSRTLKKLDMELRTKPEDHALHRWKGCFLFLDMKDSKSILDGDDMAGLLRELMPFLETNLDNRFLNPKKFWLDLGLVPSEVEEGGVATTWLWRRCCLEASLKVLKPKGGSNSYTEFRAWCMTNNIASVNVEPSKNNVLGKCGLS